MTNERTNTTEASDKDPQLSTAIGAASGLATGAAVGAVVAGPTGAVAGGAAGALVGGVGMRLLADGFDPVHIDKHWRDRFEREPYYESGRRYEDYAPAYHLGAAARQRNPDASFEESEAAMEAEWMGLSGESGLAWERAKEAARASFHTEYY